MDKFIKSFTDKKFRYGAFSTLTVTFVIAALVAVNLVVSLFDIRFDLSPDKLYSISQESKDILANVTDDVTIYALFKTDAEDMLFSALLDDYAQSSGHINVVYKDPYLYPQFVDQYKTDNTDIPVGSIIVESKKRNKVIKYDELYTVDYDMYNYTQYTKSIDFEPQVTNAIKYVTDDNTPVIYQITNHSEAQITGNIEKQITLANYVIQPLNIFEADTVPEDASMLLLATPARDYSPDEAQKVKDYLAGGGRALVFVDYMTDDQPNYNSIIETYGVELGNNLVLEASLSNTISYPYYLLPNYGTHEIVSNFNLNKINVLLTYSSSLNRMAAVKNSTSIEPLLTTSMQSYAKTGDNVTSLNKEPGDEDGPFNVAVAITDSVYIPETLIAKLVVVSTSSVLDNSWNSFVSGGNGDFILNSVNWLNDRNDTVYIRPITSTGPENLVINDMHGRILSLASMFVIPGIIIVAGITVWLRRRNR